MTYLLNDNKSLRPHKLRKTKVILDGNNLLHSIHHAHNVSWEFGGEYDAFAKAITKFFDRLKLCEIEPFVVFDGCYDAQGSKLKTTVSRFRDRILTCSRINQKYPCDGYLIPMLSVQTMISVLRKLNIPFTTCHEEADREAAALANHWHCPVISNDSDFFIFSLTNGFIPVGSLNFIPIEESCSCCTGNSHHFLSCAIFHQSNLIVNRTDNIIANGEMMPLFATLMGNDFFSATHFYAIFEQIGKSKAVSNSVKIVTLLNWLHQFSSCQIALTKIISSLPEKDRNFLESKIMTSLQQYDLGHSMLVTTVSNGGDCDCPHCRGSIIHRLPANISHLLNNHSLSPILMNSILSGNVFLHTYVESSTLDSVHTLTQPMRDFFYKSLSKQSNSADRIISEYQRKSKSIYKRKIRISEIEDKTHWINELQESILDHRSFMKTMLFYCVNLRGVDNWSKASALSLVAGVLIQYAWQQELSKPESTFQKDRYQTNVQKFFKPPIISNTNKLQIKVIHIVNELQSVYFCLSQILCLGDRFSADLVPAPEDLFSGKLLYNLHLDFLKRKDCLAFVSGLFDEFPCAVYKDFFLEVAAEICDVLQK